MKYTTDIILVTLTTCLAAFFHLLSNYYDSNVCLRRNFAYISGVFWFLSGLVVILFIS